MVATGGQRERRYDTQKCSCNILKNVLSTHMFDASSLGVGTVLRLEWSAWSMI